MKDPRLILGLNAFGFNTASCLLSNGTPVFAVEEERLLREKRTRKFPLLGIRQGLRQAQASFQDIEAIAIAWNPAINLEAHAPAQSERLRYIPEALYSVPSHLLSLHPKAECTHTRQNVALENGHSLDIHYINHHLCHAAAALASPFEQAAILTVDGFGEKQTTTFNTLTDGQLRCVWAQEFPHSLGALYSTFTEYCGFKPQSDEWKLMGAAPYGNPQTYYDRLRSLIRFEEQGFLLDLAYFNHYQFHRPHYYSPRLSTLLGLPPNPRDTPLTEAYYDLAAAAQRLMEETYFHLLRQLHRQTGLAQLVIAGGTALNSVANGKVLANSPFSDVFIPPVPDDSGGSLGAALYLDNQILGHPRTYQMRHNYLGPGYEDAEIEETLRKYHLRYTRVENPEESAAEKITEGRIIAWFQGRLEFGDRALGNRSILGDPRDPSMKDKINACIKYREAFRPFAPAILEERAHEYFADFAPTPFMEKVYPIRPDMRARIPAVTHVDGSGRLQTVSQSQNPRFYRLIQAFEKRTGIPLVINTSFNLRGEAMVCSPQDAIRTFYTSGLDTLFLGPYMLEK